MRDAIAARGTRSGVNDDGWWCTAVPARRPIPRRSPGGGESPDRCCRLVCRGIEICPCQGFDMRPLPDTLLNAADSGSCHGEESRTRAAFVGAGGRCRRME
jgi:hypothetical protein